MEGRPGREATGSVGRGQMDICTAEAKLSAKEGEIGPLFCFGKIGLQNWFVTQTTNQTGLSICFLVWFKTTIPNYS